MINPWHRLSLPSRCAAGVLAVVLLGVEAPWPRRPGAAPPRLRESAASARAVEAVAAAHRPALLGLAGVTAVEAGRVDGVPVVVIRVARDRVDGARLPQRLEGHRVVVREDPGAGPALRGDRSAPGRSTRP